MKRSYSDSNDRRDEKTGQDPSKRLKKSTTGPTPIEPFSLDNRDRGIESESEMLFKQFLRSKTETASTAAEEEEEFRNDRRPSTSVGAISNLERTKRTLIRMLKLRDARYDAKDADGVFSPPSSSGTFFSNAIVSNLKNDRHTCNLETCHPLNYKSTLTTIPTILSNEKNKDDDDDDGDFDYDPQVYVCDYGYVHVCKSKDKIPFDWLSSAIGKDFGTRLKLSGCALYQTADGEVCCKISGQSVGYTQANPFVPKAWSGKGPGGYGHQSAPEDQKMAGKDALLDRNQIGAYGRWGSSSSVFAGTSFVSAGTTFAQRDGRTDRNDRNETTEKDASKETTTIDLAVKGTNLSNRFGASIGLQSLLSLSEELSEDEEEEDEEKKEKDESSFESKDGNLSMVVDKKDRAVEKKRERSISIHPQRSVVSKRRTGGGCVGSGNSGTSKRDPTGRGPHERIVVKAQPNNLMHVRLKKKTAKKRKQMREQTRRSLVKKILEEVIIKNPLVPSSSPSSSPSPSLSHMQETEKISHAKKKSVERENGGGPHDPRPEDGGGTLENREIRPCNQCGSANHILDPAKRRMRYTTDKLVALLKFPSKILAEDTAPEDSKDTIATGKDDFASTFASKFEKEKGLSSSLVPSSSMGVASKLSGSERFEKKKEAENFVKRLFYSDVRTQIYEASVMVPRDKGERAVKGEWTAAIKAHKKRQDVEKQRAKIKNTAATAGRQQIKGAPRAARASERATAAAGGIPLSKREPPDYIMSADSPGFTIISGFTTYVNAAHKNMRIRKTPRLPYDKVFVSYFSEIALSHWEVLKGHRLGRSYVKDKKSRSSATTTVTPSIGRSTGNPRAIKGGPSSKSFLKLGSKRRKTTAVFGNGDGDVNGDMTGDGDGGFEEGEGEVLNFEPFDADPEASPFAMTEEEEEEEEEGSPPFEKLDATEATNLEGIPVVSGRSNDQKPLSRSNAPRFLKNTDSPTLAIDVKKVVKKKKEYATNNDDDDKDEDEDDEKEDADSKKSKKPLGTLCFSGLCIALLYMMRMGARTKGGRNFVWKCKYVADNVPQMKDLEAYDRRYTCKLINGCTAIIKAVYDRMETERSLPENELDRMEAMTKFYNLSSSFTLPSLISTTTANVGKEGQ